MVDGSLVGSGVNGSFVGSGVGVVVDLALVLDVGDVAVLVGRVGHDLMGCYSICFSCVIYAFSVTTQLIG